VLVCLELFVAASGIVGLEAAVKLLERLSRSAVFVGWQQRTDADDNRLKDYVMRTAEQVVLVLFAGQVTAILS
jgi:hypothetical protein